MNQESYTKIKEDTNKQAGRACYISQKTDPNPNTKSVIIKLSVFQNKESYGQPGKKIKSLIKSKIIQAYPRFLNSNIKYCKTEAPQTRSSK